jgi:hypothetical protein
MGGGGGGHWVLPSTFPAADITLVLVGKAGTDRQERHRQQHPWKQRVCVGSTRIPASR